MSLWTITEGTGGNAGYFYEWDTSYNYASLYFAFRLPNHGASVRLIKDDDTLANYVGNDGKTYLTVKIGTQVWMAENLAETKYANGDTIPEVTDNDDWLALTSGALCAYDNDWNYV